MNEIKHASVSQSAPIQAEIFSDSPVEDAFDADAVEQGGPLEGIIDEIVALEWSYFFEKRNNKTELRRKLRELIERHTKIEDAANDS